MWNVHEQSPDWESSSRKDPRNHGRLCSRRGKPARRTLPRVSGLFGGRPPRVSPPEEHEAHEDRGTVHEGSVFFGTSFLRSSSRISRLRSFPTRDRGSMSRNSTYWGTLWGSRRFRHHPMSSGPPTPRASSFRTTMALIRSPRGPPPRRNPRPRGEPGGRPRFRNRRPESPGVE